MTEKNKIIIGLVGEIASGKGATAEYLRKKYRASYYRMSDPLRAILDDLDQEINRRNMSFLGTGLRKIFGGDFIVKALAKTIKKDDKRIIVIDGVRNEEEVKSLKKIKGFHLLYITADEIVRYERLINRFENQDDRKKTLAEFKKEYGLETERHIPRIGKKADFKITNDNDLKTLRKNIDSLLKKIKS